MNRAAPWAVAACLVVVGCSPASQPPVVAVERDHAHDHDHDHDHDHEHDGDEHGHPETLAAAVAELETLCNRTRDALAAGDLEKADGPVHMVGHLLEDMTTLAAAARPGDAEAGAAASKAIEDIFECFDAIDTAIHAADGRAAAGVDYAAHAPRIEAAIAKLREIGR
ncbi:MAG: hypothetical protein EBZ59_05705 [Planctomycetia bacterium]|nr:hypothetical protein [Planctomycetia bacterium]